MDPTLGLPRELFELVFRAVVLLGLPRDLLSPSRTRLAALQAPACVCRVWRAHADDLLAKVRGLCTIPTDPWLRELRWLMEDMPARPTPDLAIDDGLLTLELPGRKARVARIATEPLNRGDWFAAAMSRGVDGLLRVVVSSLNAYDGTSQRVVTLDTSGKSLVVVGVGATGTDYVVSDRCCMSDINPWIRWKNRYDDLAVGIDDRSGLVHDDDGTKWHPWCDSLPLWPADSPTLFGEVRVRGGNAMPDIIRHTDATRVFVTILCFVKEVVSGEYFRYCRAFNAALVFLDRKIIVCKLDAIDFPGAQLDVVHTIAVDVPRGSRITEPLPGIFRYGSAVVNLHAHDEIWRGQMCDGEAAALLDATAE